MLAGFRSHFWQPPRAHGEVIEDRSVSFLELFHDLVYVVVIARAAHHLAGHVSWQAAGEFTVVMGLIWIAWINATIYHELHGREDGRTRVFVFAQMLLLALLAVFTSGATGVDGVPFAITYAVFFVVLTWLWYSVRRQDSEEFMSITARYLTGMLISIVVMVGSAFFDDGVRLIIWAVFVGAWAVGNLALQASSNLSDAAALRATDSMIERFGLFTIIVLGEVVVGVVTGLSEAERTFANIGIGLIGLMIGFGIWWTYFDFVGSRRPKDERVVLWQLGHFPIGVSIAASGAAMVSLVERASEGTTPTATGWLLAGSIATGLLALVATMATLEDFDRFGSVYKPLIVAMALGSAASVLVGLLSPPPALFVSLLVAILAAVWLVAVNRSWKLDDPKAAYPGG